MKLPTREAPAWILSAILHIVVLALMGGVTYYYQEEQRIAVMETKLSRRPIQEVFTRQMDTMEAGTVGDSLSQGSVSRAPGKKSLHKQAVEAGRLARIGLPTGLRARMLPSSSGMGKQLKRRTGETDYAQNVHEAVDRFTKELVLLMRKSRILAIWLFDESISVRDEQEEVRKRFERVYAELGLQKEKGHLQQASIQTVIASFGKNVHFQLKKPSVDLQAIKAAIKKVPIDKSGAENFCKAVRYAANEFKRWRMAQGRQMVICLVTDESGDDFHDIEETIRFARDSRIPIYVLGRQAVLGYEWGYEHWTDPETKITFPIRVRRGPESADVECLQTDGIHGRWDQIPSGFGPYAMTRLARETGGIYFILPTAGERRYDFRNLREYVPEYIFRKDYVRRRSASTLRKGMYTTVLNTKDIGFLYHHPVIPREFRKLVPDLRKKAKRFLEILRTEETRLRRLKVHRAREPLARWRAGYDLMLAQVVGYQVVQKEYMLFMKEMEKNLRKPNRQNVKVTGGAYSVKHHEFLLIRRKQLRDPTNSKSVDEAVKMLDYVIRKHPGTPWAERAKYERNLGFSVDFRDWYRDPRYNDVKKPQL